MSKLIIQRLRDAGSEGWHMRFGGDPEDFREMVSDLKWEGCRWDPAAFEGRGAWSIPHSTLLMFSDRFTNVQASIEREQRRRTYTGGKSAEQAKERSIDDVPF